MQKKNYYEILGVPRNATQKEIDKAFKKLARKHHPDVNPGNKEAEQRFKEIAEAHSVLGDPEKRKKYDQYGRAAFQAGFEPGRTYTYTTDLGDFNLGDVFGKAGQGFGDIFEDLFSRQKRATPQKGEDIQYTVELSFDDAVRGTMTTIAINREAPCETCGGSGEQPGSVKQTCPRCGGTGEISIGKSFLSFTQTCPQCRGTGRVASTPCTTCGGRGTTMRSERLQVKIPAGVDNGSKVRLQGKGSPGKNGGPPGDLYIITNVRPHPYFERKGDNIYIEVPITITEAALGTKVDVPTIDSYVAVNIPPGVHSGKMLRLKGKGVPHLKGGGQGDQYVVVKIVAPPNLDHKTRELLSQVAQLAPYDPRAELSWRAKR